MTKDGRALGNSESGDYMFTSRGGGRYGLACRLKLLRNRIFYERYILRNARGFYDHGFGYNPKLSRSILAFAWRAVHKVARSRFVPGGRRALLFLLRLYYTARFLLGKVDVPNIEVSLTTKCTLRCAACNNMMQYFGKDTHYTCTLGGIKASLDALFKVADSVVKVRVYGGEPLLFKELAQVIWFLRESPKVKSFDIVTNGTLDFKEDVLDALEGTYKARVEISDYKNSPNLAVPLRQESVIAALEKHNIAYGMVHSKNTWWDPGRVYKRGRAKEEVVKNFRACMLPCVTMMSGEGVKDDSLAPLGAAFICPPAAALSRLKGLAEFEGDFVDLASATKERVIEFYAQDYFKACDYCQDKWEEKRFITPAVQTKEVFSVSADS